MGFYFISKGDDFGGSGLDENIFTAGIKVGDWRNRIECYGLSEEEAIKLRDWVFDAITEKKKREQITE